MIDLKALRENPDKFKQGAARKGIDRSKHRESREQQQNHGHALRDSNDVYVAFPHQSRLSTCATLEGDCQINTTARPGERRGPEMVR